LYGCRLVLLIDPNKMRQLIIIKHIFRQSIVDIDF